VPEENETRYVWWRNPRTRAYHVRDTKSGHVTVKNFYYMGDAQERATWLNDGIKYRHGYRWMKETDA